MSARTAAPWVVYRSRRTWGELAYALLGLPVGVAVFTYTAVTLWVSIGLSVTLVGIPLLALTGLLSRTLAEWVRRLGNALTGVPVAAPPPFRPKAGFLGWLGSCLKDAGAWRARLYLLLKLPLGILTFVRAVALLTYGLGGLTYASWRPFLPCNTSNDGRCHRGIQVWTNYTLDTPWTILLVAVVGLALVLALPWVVRGVVWLDRTVTRALVGRDETGERVDELTTTRASAVDDAAATLRRVERDLHDGAQARLVAVAMNVGLAREKLAEGGDPAETQQLLDSAHATAKAAIAELRDLARGIHPAALDAGLDAALATLAANSAVPVRLRTAIAVRPSPAVETIAYFCVAELITNVAKHSGADAASVEVRTDRALLRVVVADEGRGGADLLGGSGLAGLTERVRTVDGTLTVTSPPGGPTAVAIDLPLAGRR